MNLTNVKICRVGLNADFASLSHFWVGKIYNNIGILMSTFVYRLAKSSHP
jgi:hypothetical protein